MSIKKIVFGKNMFKLLKSRKFKLHPTFFLALLLFFFMDKLLWFFQYFFCLIFHELSHAFVARKRGYKIQSMVLLPFGLSLDGNFDEFGFKDEIIIALAGPLCNLFLSLICVSLWWIVPELYYYTSFFMFANLVCCFFNLLPVYPLDGGRVLLALLSCYKDRICCVKFVKSLTMLFSFLLFLLFLISLFYQANFSFAVMSIILIVSVFMENNNLKYVRVLNLALKSKKILRNSLKINLIVVFQSIIIKNMLKLLDPMKFNVFYVYDKNVKIVELSEFDLQNLLLNFDANMSLSDVLYKSKFIDITYEPQSVFNNSCLTRINSHSTCKNSHFVCNVSHSICDNSYSACNVSHSP